MLNFPVYPIRQAMKVYRGRRSKRALNLHRCTEVMYVYVKSLLVEIDTETSHQQADNAALPLTSQMSNAQHLHRQSP